MNVSMATLKSVIWILAGKEKKCQSPNQKEIFVVSPNCINGFNARPEKKSISKHLQVQKLPAKEKQQTFSHLQISTNPIRKHGARPGSSLFYHYITRYRATRRQTTIARPYQ